MTQPTSLELLAYRLGQAEAGDNVTTNVCDLLGVTETSDMGDGLTVAYERGRRGVPLADPRPGTYMNQIVTPDGAGGEVIVGIVIDEKVDTVGHVLVVCWLSDQRGAFVCNEQPSDVAIAALADRDSGTDVRLNHETLAELIGDALDAECDGAGECSHPDHHNEPGNLTPEQEEARIAIDAAADAYRRGQDAAKQLLVLADLHDSTDGLATHGMVHEALDELLHGVTDENDVHFILAEVRRRAVDGNVGTDDVAAARMMAEGRLASLTQPAVANAIPWTAEHLPALRRSAEEFRAAKERALDASQFDQAELLRNAEKRMLSEIERVEAEAQAEIDAAAAAAAAEDAEHEREMLLASLDHLLIRNIVARKLDGTDTTDDESGFVKAWFRVQGRAGAGQSTALNRVIELFPLEWAEVGEEDDEDLPVTVRLIVPSETPLPPIFDGRDYDQPWRFATISAALDWAAPVVQAHEEIVDAVILGASIHTDGLGGPGTTITTITEARRPQALRRPHAERLGGIPDARFVEFVGPNEKWAWDERNQTYLVDPANGQVINVAERRTPTLREALASVGQIVAFEDEDASIGVVVQAAERYESLRQHATELVQALDECNPLTVTGRAITALALLRQALS